MLLVLSHVFTQVLLMFTFLHISKGFGVGLSDSLVSSSRDSRLLLWIHESNSQEDDPYASVSWAGLLQEGHSGPEKGAQDNS